MANYFRALNEAFDNKYGLKNVVESKRNLKEADVGWFDLPWDDQVKAIKDFVINYEGTKVFEDFASSVGVDVDDIIDIFADLESHDIIYIPREIQVDSDFAHDEFYDDEDDCDESCGKGSMDKKPINEDGAEDFLNELSDTIRKDVWDVVFDDVVDAIDDFDNLPDYLPMTSEEANNQFLDAIRNLAEAAFIRYCVYMRDIQVDESIVKKVTQPIRDAADTVRDVLNIPDKNTKLDEDKGSLDNEIDRYQRWVDFDMSRYGKISERTQQMVNKAGYQILKDDHGDYEVAAGHFE